MKRKIVLASISVNSGYLLTKYYYKLPSLGIGYMAAILEKYGYEVVIIDKSVSHNKIGELVNEILGMNPDVVGFYAISETFKTILEILRGVKEKSPATVTMLGGPHVYGMPEQGMGYGWIDYSIWGEAEMSLLKLLECNFARETFPSIDGLIYRENGKVRINRIALVENLDDLPRPARHLYQPLDLYRPSILAYKRLPATGIITSRGCAHKCVFCHSGKGRFKLRFHSAEYVLEEIKQLKRDFGINELIIFDDTFLINKKRALAICEGIISQNLDISWSCNARVNNINKELLEVLKRAGCWLIQYGVESGNQDILKSIKKDITLEQVVNACELTSNMGLEVKAYYILGHPNETVDTLNDTIKFMTKAPAHYASINFMTPLPGTELWETAEQYGTIDKRKLEKINYLSDRPAFIPHGLTEEILMNKFKEAYLKFYLNPKTILRFVKTLRRVEDFKKILMAAAILLRLVKAKYLKGNT
ncbi:MAG: radical SAM protein [Deltaproteobacteria bacterium]|nr:radical SAM protein [Deltaproteobacteria bacterium]